MNQTCEREGALAAVSEWLAETLETRQPERLRC